MLYKKIHRQYLKEFRIGRKFRFKFNPGNEVYKVVRKPHIDENDYISVDYGDYKFSDIILIYLSGRKGGRRYNITWLED